MAAPTGGTTLVGREREVDVLREIIASAAAGHGRVVSIEGEPGIGKTRLVATAGEHARTAGFEVFEGRCDDLSSASRWLAAIQLHRDALQAVEQTLATAANRLADTAPQLGMGVLNWAHALVLEAREQREKAIPLWDEAIEVYQGLGAERDIARVSAHLRQRGIKRGVRRRHVRATQGWESLTATEHKVIALVAQRLSNPEVAERLFISRHTVESHLKQIYRKLGLSSRLELAALAARHAEDKVVET